MLLAAAAPALILILLAMIGYARGRVPKPSGTLGSARFANVMELRKAAMLDDRGGLCVGAVNLPPVPLWAGVGGLFDWRLSADAACHRLAAALRKRPPPPAEVRLNDAVHVSVYAPTGVGKGVNLIIPFLRSTNHSVVVYDQKAESAIAAAECMRARGFEVRFLDPYRVLTDRPDCLNPLDLIVPGEPLTIDWCRQIAAEMVVRTGRESENHWLDNAQKWIVGMTTVVATYGEPGHRDLRSVRTFLTDPAVMRKTLAEMLKDTELWGGLLARLGGSMLMADEREMRSIISTANTAMDFLDTVAVSESVRRSTFDPRGLTKKKMAIFLILPPSQTLAQQGLLRLWLGTTLRACVAGGLQEKNLVTFVLDEAASLGANMPVLEQALNVYRAYGVRLHLYYQSRGQLAACWRPGMDQVILSNTSQIYFGINDFQTAQSVSDVLDVYTASVKSAGTNAGRSRSSDERGGGNTGRSWGNNTGYADQARKLMLPGELMTLNRRVAVTLVAGMRPIVSVMTPFFEQRPPQERSRRAVRAAALLLALMASAVVWAVAHVPTRPRSPPVWTVKQPPPRGDSRR